METPSSPRPMLGGPAGPERQLPSGLSKVERISSQARGLVDDVTSYVDLRLKKAQMEIEEKVEAKIRQAAVGAVLALLGLLALVFGLTALAWGLGEWLGHPGWGFLAVTVLLLVVAGVVRALQPRLTQPATQKKGVVEEHLTHPDRYAARTNGN